MPNVRIIRTDAKKFDINPVIQYRVDDEVVAEGVKSEYLIQVKPGEHTFSCSVCRYIVPFTGRGRIYYLTRSMPVFLKVTNESLIWRISIERLDGYNFAPAVAVGKMIANFFGAGVVDPDDYSTWPVGIASNVY